LDKLKLTPKQLFDKFRHKIDWDTCELDGVIRISIIRADGIRNADGGLTGKSDPYVQIYFDNSLKATTHVKDDTLNPMWKEFFEFPIKGKFEFLYLTMFDKDLMGVDDFLGEVKISARDLWEHRIVKGENDKLGPRASPAHHPVDKNPDHAGGKDKKKEKKEKDEEAKGSIDYIVEYRPPAMDGHLSIKLEKADGCKSSDAATLNKLLHRDAKGDPYCSVLLDDEVICQTKPIHNTFDPVWNETFEIDIAGEYTDIFLSLWDEDPGLDDYISHLQISTKELREKKKIAGTFPLTQQEDKKKDPVPMGHITCSIEWFPPHLDGKIEAKIVKANDLISTQNFFHKLIGSKSDGFVEVQLDGEIRGRTKMIKGNNSPAWHEVVTIEADGKQHHSLTFVIWDKEAKGLADCMGCLEVSAQELAHFKHVTGDFVLRPYKGGAAAGSLTVDVTYTPKGAAAKK
jgi:Ca2+-dependent lipid-binding protein